MKRQSKKAKSTPSCFNGQPIGHTHLPPQSTSVGASIPNLGTLNQLGDPSSLPSPQHDPPTLPTMQDGISTLPTNHNASTNEQEPAKYRKFWKVDVVDEQGLTKEAHLRVHDAWALPPGQRVVVPWNNIGQPIGEGGGLLGIFLGTVAMDFTLFPITYTMWSTMPNVYKSEVCKNIVQAKFVVNDGEQKRFILQSIGKKWRARRGKLYKKYDKSLTREQNIANPPLGLTREQWASFIDYRNDPKTQEKSKKTKENRKKQNIPHTGGSKSIARKMAEMEIEKGAPVTRGAVWTATHKRKDGSFVNDEARLISETISNYEAEETSSQEISTEDSLAMVLGKEHPGRVRGLGLGPCPSQVFGPPARFLGGMNFSNPNTQLQTKVSQLQSQLDTSNNRVESLEVAIIFMLKKYEGHVPPEFANLQTPLVPDEGSGQASPEVASHSTPSLDNDY